MVTKDIINSLRSIVEDFKTGGMYKLNHEAVATIRDAAYTLEQHEKTAKIIVEQWKGLVADDTYHSWCGSSYGSLYEHKEIRYYCGQCGKRIDEDSHYCKHCGIKLKGKKDKR